MDLDTLGILTLFSDPMTTLFHTVEYCNKRYRMDLLTIISAPNLTARAARHRDHKSSSQNLESLTSEPWTTRTAGNTLATSGEPRSVRVNIDRIYWLSCERQKELS